MRFYATSGYVFIRLVYVYLYNQCMCIYTARVCVFIQLMHVYLYN